MKKNLFVLAAGLMIVLTAAAQEPDYIDVWSVPDGKTIVKTSITTPAFRTFSLSGERILNKKLSAVLGISFMPSGSFPHVNKILDVADMDQETNNLLSAMQMNTFSVSPELRIYTGKKKGWGRGFYVSPYYRYEKFGLKNLSVDFTMADDKTGQIMVKGGINTHSAGLMIGYQWLVGKEKNIVIDWTMLGGHYGISSGKFDGKYVGSTSLSEEDRQLAQKEIDNTFEDLPIIKAKGKINNDDTANVSISGPWAFLRGGISVGFRF